MDSNAFFECLSIEQRSWDLLEPYLKMRSFQGRFVRTAKGPLSLELQKSVGDVLVNSSREHVTCIEVKAEEAHTGNLFIERWSNRSRFTPGWFETLRTDLLWCHFLDRDVVYELAFERLRKWLYHGEHRSHPLAHKYILAKHSKREQLNDTWGYLVPINDLPRPAVLRQEFHPDAAMRNGDLFAETAA